MYTNKITNPIFPFNKKKRISMASAISENVTTLNIQCLVNTEITANFKLQGCKKHKRGEGMSAGSMFLSVRTFIG